MGMRRVGMQERRCPCGRQGRFKPLTRQVSYLSRWKCPLKGQNATVVRATLRPSLSPFVRRPYPGVTGQTGLKSAVFVRGGNLVGKPKQPGVFASFPHGLDTGDVSQMRDGAIVRTHRKPKQRSPAI